MCFVKQEPIRHEKWEMWPQEALRIQQNRQAPINMARLTIVTD